MKQEIETKRKKVQTSSDPGGAANSDKSHAILLCNSEGYYYMRLNNIIYCYSDNAYTTFFLSDGKKIMVSQSLKHFETVLTAYGFIRIHQSRMINLHHLLSVSKTDAGHVANLTNDIVLIIARQKRAKVIMTIRENSIENCQGVNSN